MKCLAEEVRGIASQKKSINLLSDLSCPGAYFQPRISQLSLKSSLCPDAGSKYINDFLPEVLLSRTVIFECLVADNTPWNAGLRELDLSYGALTGPIPSSLSSCLKLAMLNLSHNQLEGEKNRYGQ